MVSDSERYRSISEDLAPGFLRTLEKHFWRFVNWPLTNPTIIREPESTQLFFVYRGARYKHPTPPARFCQKTNLTSRNVVMFEDPYWAYYQRGISRQVRGVGQLIEHHREIIQSFPRVTELHSLGISMGGYAAILFGYYLGVDSVLAFGPVTKPRNSRIRSRTARSMPAEHRDLSDLLAEGNGTTTYRIFFSEECRSDRLAARSISHCSGVELNPVRGEDHNVLRLLVQQDRLESILPPVKSM